MPVRVGCGAPGVVPREPDTLENARREAEVTSGPVRRRTGRADTERLRGGRYGSAGSDP
ncbi:hypothetical protein GCM10018785_39230 [Streptomyces longispororuber]|uniref:Uncharacterized protein n=1 Tax=Streptomyces longispororuber TaxID=68230 RepID=A0A918ZR38_9ACTN|nr:hypothetical protein GCM10018785_39230 [Streptomyces longispororuber]